MRHPLRRILAVLALCALLAAVQTPAAAVQFTDVPASLQGAEDIQRAVELGYFQGETASTFGVGHPMTRGAFMAVLSRVFDWKTKGFTRQTYADVPQDLWCYGAVEAGVEHGAVTTQSGDFRPEDPLTREELAVMLVRALGYGPIAGLSQELPIPFRDVKTNTGYIAIAYDLGLMAGTSYTAFSPSQPASREELAAIVVRLHNKLHTPAAGTVGIITSQENLPALEDYEALAISAGRLMSTGDPVVLPTMEETQAETLRKAVQKAGAKALLYVVGGTSAMTGEPEAIAKVLAEAVEKGKYDGIFLDAGKLRADQRKVMTATAEILDGLLGEKLFYLMAEAPSWQAGYADGYEHVDLTESVDRLVLRITPYLENLQGFPNAPLDPLEEIYYALGELDGVREKLSLLVTTTGTLYLDCRERGQVSQEEIAALLKERGTESHYSSRYGSAYLTAQRQEETKQVDVVIWYLTGQGIKDRQCLAGMFGIEGVCYSDVGQLSFLAG